MPHDVYLEALEAVPRGQTRSFMELAAMAGRPGAARAVGRAVSRLGSRSSLPWHQIVSASGDLSRQPERARVQLRRLRREGARPRGRESIREWAARIGARFVGYYPERRFLELNTQEVSSWDPRRIEPFKDESRALARGFLPRGVERRELEPLPRPGPADVSATDQPPPASLGRRLDALDWTKARRELAYEGLTRFAALLTPSECRSILRASSSPERFERSVDMLPRGFGVGSYHYYREPLPEPLTTLRKLLYGALAPLAVEHWRKDFPSELGAFWKRCRASGQKRASSILICYAKGGVNHPHRDIYGRVWFPFQAFVMLSRRPEDFSGGRFYLMDDVSGGMVREASVNLGDVVVFTSRERLSGSREGRRMIPMRHGMTPVTRGLRYGAGIVFHLAD